MSESEDKVTREVLMESVPGDAILADLGEDVQTKVSTETTSNNHPDNKATTEKSYSIVMNINEKGEEEVVVTKQDPPVKRGRGRPRKDGSITPRPTHNVKKRKPKFPDPNRGIIPARRATRGKAPVKFEPDFENKKKYDYERAESIEAKQKFFEDSDLDDELDEDDLDDEEFEPKRTLVKYVDGEPPRKRKRGRPPLIKSEPLMEEQYGQQNTMANKENRPSNLPENPNVSLNITVKDKRCIPYLDQMGIYVMYFCRKCVYHSKQITDVAKHIAIGDHNPTEKRRGRRSEAQIAESVNRVMDDVTDDHFEMGKRDEGQEHMNIALIEGPENVDHAEQKPSKPWKQFARVHEHSYAEVEIDDSSDERDMKEHKDREPMEEKDVENDLAEEWDEIDSDDDVDPNAPKKWLCNACHYTTFFSERDFIEHRRCHGPDKSGVLHCWRCKEDGKRNILKGFEWHRLKVHLTTVHLVDYRIDCPKCGEMFSTHMLYRKHRQIHRIKCSHSFCKYETDKPEDMDAHFQCHSSEDPKNFACFKCNYVCERRPFKWSTIHNHLVTAHPGVISANYICRDCRKGFQEMRRYAEHRKTCGDMGGMMQCELCDKMIYKSKFMSHAVWHIKKEEIAEEKKRKDMSYQMNLEEQTLEAAEVLAAVAETPMPQASVATEPSLMLQPSLSPMSQSTLTPALATEAAVQQFTIETDVNKDDLADKAIAEVLVAAAAAGHPMEMSARGEHQVQTIVLGPEEMQQLADGANEGDTIVAIVEESEADDGTSQQTVTYHIQGPIHHNMQQDQLPIEIVEQEVHEVAQQTQEIMHLNRDVVHKVQDVVQENQQIMQENQDVMPEAQEVVQEDQQIMEENQDMMQEAQEVVQEDQQIMEENQDVMQEAQDVVQVDQQIMEENQDVMQEGHEMVQEGQEVIQEKDLTQNCKEVTEESQVVMLETFDTVKKTQQEGEEGQELLQGGPGKEGMELTVQENSEIFEAGVGQFLCFEHNKRFISQLELTRHYVEVHWGITPDVLKQAEDDLAKKREERRLAMIREDKDDVLHKCKHCYKKFASLPRLNKHTRRAHTMEKLKRVLCQTCGKDFRNRSQFRNHYRVVHEGKKRKPPVKPYYARRKFFVCEQCGYTTPESLRLKNHKMSVHDGVLPYQCDVCSYATNEKSDMRRHKHKHAGIKRYPCEFCSYRTDQRWLLVNHCHRQHGIQLPKVSRDTRGCFWSNRRKRKGDEEALRQTIIIQPPSLAVEQVEDLLDVQTTGTAEEVTILYQDYVEEQGLAVGTEEEVAVETIQQETRETGEVVYMREDGTILEPEEAALMLLAVNSEGVQVETNYE